jgi:hypothetical protein
MKSRFGRQAGVAEMSEPEKRSSLKPAAVPESALVAEIPLYLSGVGYRTRLSSPGALIRLIEAGLLEKLGRLLGVSGGSMIIFIGSRARAYFRALVIVLFAIAVNPEARADEQTSAKIASPEMKVVAAQAFPADDRGIAFEGVIEIEIDGLAEYLNQPPAKLGEPQKKPSDFILFLDNRPLPGLPVRRVSITGVDRNKLQFDLTRTTDSNSPAENSNHAGWDALLGSPFGWPGYSRNVRGTAGLPNQPLDSNVDKLKLIVVSRLWGWIAIAGMAALTILLLVLAVSSDVLRDIGPPVPRFDVNGIPVRENGKLVFERKPFSLARVQLAIWFWTIIASYVFIWVMNCETGSLTGQVLGILAISTLTLVGSVAMDVRNADKQRASLNETIKSIADKELQSASIAAKLMGAPNDPVLNAGKAQLEKEIADLKSQVATTTQEVPKQRIAESFFRDILSDSNGVSFHRFQIFAWTLVVVVVFLEHVWQTLAMPQLNEYLLTLMGMSAGTYVGMKSAEANAASGATG